MSEERRPRILNVDDDDAGRYATSRILTAAGFEVVEATTGRDALRLVAEHPDLVLLDVNLPDIGGFEVCARIKSDPTTAGIPVVHLSATAIDSNARTTGLEGGADGYLTQPVGARELVASLRATLRLRDVERRLHESEQRFRRLFEAETDAVFLIDNETGRLMEANGAASAMYGYSSDELAALTDLDLTAESEQTLAATRGAPAEGGTAVTVPLRIHLRKDGSELPVEITGSNFTLRGRSVRVAVVRDISERQRLADALDDERQRFKLLVENSSEAFLLSQPDGVVHFANPAACRLFGCCEEDIRRMGRDGLVDAADPRLARGLEMRARTGRFSGELRCLRADGTTFEGEVSTSVYADHTGVERTSMIIRDLTERKAAEAALRVSEAELRTVMETVPDAVFQVDRDCRLVIANEGYARATATTQGRAIAIGEPVLASDYPEEVLRMWRGYYDRAFGGESFVEELSFPLPDGNYCTENHFSPVRAGDGEVIGVVVTSRDISDRKRAEQALRESEARFRGYFEQSLVGVAVTAPDKGWIEVNQATCDLLGYSPVELSELTWAQLTHPDDLAADVAQFERVAAGEIDGYRIEKRFVRKGGEVIDVDLSVRCHRRPNGSIDYFLALLADITERRRAEQALRESEELYRSILIASPDGIAITDLTGAIRMTSPAGSIMFGEPEANALGRSLAEFLVPEDRERAAANMSLMLHDAGKGPGEYRGLRADGSTLPIEVNGEIIREADGRPVSMVFVMRDVTERKRAEQALTASEEKHRLLIENSYDIIYTLTSDGIFTFVSPAWTMLLGHPVDQVSGRPFRQFVHPDDLAACVVFLQAVVAGGQRRDGVEYRVRHLDGSWRWHTSSAVPQRDESGVIIGLEGVARDINDGKLAEEALARLNIDLIDEAAALAEANATITRIAATDDLTGLANRRHFYQSLEKAVSLARRHGTPLALVSLDLDGLKRVNDTLGHEAGDEVLASFAELLAALCRTEDLPARLGGDELSVLLPGMELGGAQGLAERALAAVRACAALAQRGVTVSAGVAQWTPGELPDDLLRRADEALYTAKRGGGDAVAGGA